VKLCGFEVGNDQPLFLIAGTCVVESEQMTLDTAGTLKEVCGALGMPFIYKSSFDKANRSSRDGFRGPGMEEGLRILSEVKKQLDLPVLTDVHEDTLMDEVADVVDVLQTPAFLCRQTNFILRTAATGLPVNIKKGQFLSPWEMQNVVDKARSTGNDNIMVCERGFSFGYNNLVSDMRSLAVMRGTGAPVVFDATHSGCNPFRSTTGWFGHFFRWTTGVYSSAGTFGSRGRCRRILYGDAPGSVKSIERWSERLAVGQDETTS